MHLISSAVHSLMSLNLFSLSISYHLSISIDRRILARHLGSCPCGRRLQNTSDYLGFRAPKMAKQE
jgi:hypothetical protein